MTPKAKGKPNPKGKNKKPTKPKKRYDWIRMEAEFVASEPDTIPTLEEFFKASGISKNTYVKHTRDWHHKRTQHRKKIAQDLLSKYRRDSVQTIMRQANQGRAAGELAFRALIGKDEDGNAILKVNLRPSELIRLYDAGTRNEGRALALAKLIEPSLMPEDLPGQEPTALPPAAADEVPVIDVKNEREVSRRRIQAILKDKAARAAAEKLIEAIEKDGADA